MTEERRTKGRPKVQAGRRAPIKSESEVTPVEERKRKKPSRVLQPSWQDRKFAHDKQIPVIDAFDKALKESQVIPEDDRRSAFYLRNEARLAFISDFNGISVAQLSRDPRFAEVSYDQLAKWATTDKWNEARKEVIDELHSRMLDKMMDVAVRQRVKDLTAIRPVAEKLLEKFTPSHEFRIKAEDIIKDTPEYLQLCERCNKPKEVCQDPFYGVSADKRVTAYARLAELMMLMEREVRESTLMRAASEPMNPRVKDVNSAPPIDVQLSDEEAQIAAHSIMTHRNTIAAVVKEEK